MQTDDFFSFHDVIEGEEFLALSLSEVKDFMREVSDVDSDDLVKAAFVWTNHCSENRVSSMEDVLVHIKFERCTKDILNTIKEQYNHILQVNPVFYRFYREALKKP